MYMKQSNGFTQGVFTMQCVIKHNVLNYIKKRRIKSHLPIYDLEFICVLVMVIA